MSLYRLVFKFQIEDKFILKYIVLLSNVKGAFCFIILIGRFIYEAQPFYSKENFE